MPKKFKTGPKNNKVTKQANTFVRKDYQKQFEEMQRGLKGQKNWVKQAEYRKFYKQIAKAADQRLVELERLSEKKGYKEVKQWAYANAMYDIKTQFGEDAKRFNRKLSEDMKLPTLYKNINRVLKFLNAPTSSVSGITEVYDKRTETLNTRYGLNLNWDSTGHLFESTLWKKVNSRYGSATALKAIGIIQKNRSDIKKALEAHKPISFTIEDNAKVEDAVNKFLRYYKKDTSKLIKKV